MRESEPRDGETQDLYLKGEGYDSKGKAIDFDEKIIGTGHGTGGGDLRWQLTVFASKNFKLGELGGGDGGYAPDDTINCDKKGLFEKNGSQGWMGEDQWEKAVNSVKFKLTNCEKNGGRRKCDIEIADVKNLLTKRNWSSLAFKSEWSGIAQNDLYLKGLNTKTGAEIDWDEKLEFGVGGTNKWQLSVTEDGETEIIDLGKASTGWGEAETFNCDPRNVFKITQPTYGWEAWEGKKWVKSASNIKFKLADKCTETKGRVECDIEITNGGEI